MDLRQAAAISNWPAGYSTDELQRAARVLYVALTQYHYADERARSAWTQKLHILQARLQEREG